MNIPISPRPSKAGVLRSIGRDRQLGTTVALLLLLALVSGFLDLAFELSTHHELPAVLAMTAIVGAGTVFSAMQAVGHKVEGLRTLTIVSIAVVLVAITLAGTPSLPLVPVLYVAAAVTVPWIAGFTLATFTDKKETRLAVVSSNDGVASAGTVSYARGEKVAA